MGNGCRQTVLLEGIVNCVVKSSNNIFAAVENSGIYKSSNMGNSWSSINTGFDYDSLFVKTIAIKGDTLIIGTGKSGVWQRPLSDFAGIKENTLSNQISIYPNPTSNNLTIETNINKETKLEIVNLLGQTIYISYINNKARIDVSAFPKGVYFIKLNTEKETVVKKFVKE